MLISILAHLKYATREPCSLLLQVDAANDAHQSCDMNELSSASAIDWRIVSGEENIGRRRWGIVEGNFDCTYKAHVRVDRPEVDLPVLDATPLVALPNDVNKFLMPSRYCHPEDFGEFLSSEFAGLSGGPLIAELARWIKAYFTYDISASNGATTATNSFLTRAGVCRDYAHVLIAMSRSAGIPARIVSAYAPNVEPQDFHAVAELFLDGAWHIVDPTGMARAPEIVRIGVGRDAADVSFMTSYGQMELINQSVQVFRID